MRYQLNKVRPKHTLFFICPCESKCAYIRNKSVDSINSNDIGGVAFRYLQSRAGQYNTRNEAAVFAILGTAGTLTMGLTLGATAAFNIAFFGNVPPNLGNTGRYRKTKRGCKQWLRDSVGEEIFNEIQQLKYNAEGIHKLVSILQAAGIDVSVPKRHMTQKYILISP